VLAYLYVFIRYGSPNPEQLGRTAYEQEVDATRAEAQGALAAPT
jgi:hypothetical protein